MATSLIVLAAAGSLAYWPGLMNGDSVFQYVQARRHAFQDWNPPMMAALWWPWALVWKGPGPMLLVQLSLYAAGLGLLVRWALKRGERRRALALAACALLPLSVVLMANVIKDALMAAVLVCAVGLWIGAAPGDRWRKAAAAALVLGAATVRYNGFLAGVPLLAALAPASWRDRPGKLAAVALASAAVLLAAMPAANRLLHARESGVEYSLIIFDLAGIDYYSGQDVFPPMGVADAAAVHHRCYTPKWWDSYNDWAPWKPCRVDFYRVKAAFERQGVSPQGWWLGAILSHPLAYAEHRLAHWNINAAFLVHREAEPPVELRSAPGAEEFPVPDTPLVRGVDRLARWSAATPLGWPACWMALAFGLVVLSPRLPSGTWAGPLTLSALLYGLGYGPFSVSTDERYYLWTMVASALALALVLTDRVDWRAIGRVRLIAAGAPVATVVALSILWRLL